jgi:hypothetical protein
MIIKESNMSFRVCKTFSRPIAQQIVHNVLVRDSVPVLDFTMCDAMQVAIGMHRKGRVLHVSEAQLKLV